MPGARLIIPGEQISRTPMLKLVRANRISAELYQDYAGWAASGAPQTRAEYSDDRKTAVLRAALPSSPNVDDWTLRYADAVHNFRAALDGLAWEVAHLDDMKPTARAARKLYFPLAKTREQWEDTVGQTLSSVPADVLTRIESVQPFMAVNQEAMPMLLLHSMDLQDKHRSSLAVHLTGRDRQALTLMMRFPADHHVDDDPLLDDGYEFLADGIAVRDGVEVARLTARIPFADVSIHTLPLTLDTVVDGKRYDAFELLRGIDRHVTGIFMTVLLGGLVPEWQEFVVWGAPRPKTPWI